MGQETDEWAQLALLHQSVLARAKALPSQSYTAKLMQEGAVKIAKKLGEEAIETALAAATKDRDGVIGESADLLYHLIALWANLGIRPKEVMERLAAREGRSGLEEKAARGLGRTKEAKR